MFSTVEIVNQERCSPFFDNFIFGVVCYLHLHLRVGTLIELKGELVFKNILDVLLADDVFKISQLGVNILS